MTAKSWADWRAELTAVTRVLMTAESWADWKAVPMAVLRASTMAGS